MFSLTRLHACILCAQFCARGGALYWEASVVCHGAHETTMKRCRSCGFTSVGVMRPLRDIGGVACFGVRTNIAITRDWWSVGELLALSGNCVVLPESQRSYSLHLIQTQAFL